MRQRKVWIHLGFWAAYLLPNLLLGYKEFPSTKVFLVYFFSIIGFTAGVFYLISEWLIPLVLAAKGKKLGVWLLIPLVWILASCLNMWLETFLYTQYFPNKEADYQPSLAEYLLGMFWLITVSSGVAFGHLWYESQINKREAETLKIRTELDHLRYRVSPHFLFNTLNNIYALALDKSDKTPRVVLQLSYLMRYIIQNEQDKVPLATEITYLENYLALEKVRLGEHSKIKMNVKGNLKNQMIAPMLLLPFVENSFKHGLGSSTLEGYVEIEIQIVENKLFFYIENSKKESLSPKTSTGMGLPNVKRRLDLIYGKNGYKLEILDTHDKYSVNLYLELN